VETPARGSLVGTVVDGRYEVRAMLARGGMATVYEAVDLRLDRVVALKVMHAHLADDPDFVSRFEREAKAAARLTHPHVVGVYDQGKADGHVYLAMEYVPGRTLRDVMKQFGPLTPEQSLVLLDPILEALEAAHGAGFVHRDIKPENVLISDDGRVKVADFGLARAVETSNASATQGMIIGTVAYLSPEQVERGDADGRSDVYAAGILLFEMITGQVPHAGDSPLSVAYKHVNSDVPAPSTVNSAIQSDVDALVITATRRDPEARYPDAASFLADVRRVRATLPRPRPFTDSRDTLVVDASMTQRIAAGARPPQEQHAAPVEHRRSRKGRWIALIVAIAVLLAALGGWLIAGSILAPKVQVPTIVGLTQSDAQATLTTAGLTLAISEQQFSESAPTDTVISSDPAPGGEVAEGGTVDAVISKGPERYSVPDVTGMTPDAAVTEITAAKLVAGAQTQVFDDTVAVGSVAGTDPKIGTSVKPGTSVSILISKGPKPVPVPDIDGKKSAVAQAALTEIGLIPVITEKYSEKVPEGQVIKVTPKPGTVVNSGTEVELVVSKGPPPVEVPTLVDLRKSQAIAILKKLGLVPKVISAGFTPLNRVFSQDPPAGTMIPKGSVVTIRIV
jgi:serine/threonine-protein kinase